MCPGQHHQVQSFKPARYKNKDFTTIRLNMIRFSGIWDSFNHSAEHAQVQLDLGFVTHSSSFF